MARTGKSVQNGHKDAVPPRASRSFPPLARSDARILVLGSLPGRRSLAAGQYYAHPRNAFWPIMRELTGAEGSYEMRCRALLDSRVALWDVLYESVRPGSMDADIRMDSARVNDFASFFERHPGIGRVCFNGKKAAAMFAKFVAGDVQAGPADCVTLPSTSPAYAAMTYDDKLARWRSALESGETT